MKKRVFSTILCVVILLSLSLTTVITASAASETISYSPYAYFYKTTDGTPTIVTTGIQDELVSFVLPDKSPYHTGMAYIYSGSDQYIFKAGYTYTISYDIGFLDGKVPNARNFTGNVCVGATRSDLDASLSNNFTGTITSPTLKTYFSDVSQSYVFDSSTNIGTLSIIIHSTANIPTSEISWLCPVFLVFQQNGDGEPVTYSIGFAMEGVADFDQSLYDDAVSQQQTEIKNAIQSGFQETNSSLNEIKDVLTGDGDYTFEKNDQLQSSIQENAALEEEIYDSILNNTVELPNGDTISTDSLNFNDVYLSIEQTYNAPVFEEDMAAQIDKIFDIFMPYLGTVIFLSLTLGLCIAFLTGRRLQ